MKVRNNNGQTPIEICLPNEKQKDEDCCLEFLKRNSPLSEPNWNKLLIYSLKFDFVPFVKLAHQRNIYLHNVLDEQKFSFTK